MTLNVNTVRDNPSIPGMTAYTYIPDQLLAGGNNLTTDTASIGAGNLVRGTMLGMITASNSYIVCVKTANDGSQVPCAVLADRADATAGPVNAPVYLTGEFNSNAIVRDVSWTLPALKGAARQLGIVLKSAVSAADPT